MGHGRQHYVRVAAKPRRWELYLFNSALFREKVRSDFYVCLVPKNLFSWTLSQKKHSWSACGWGCCCCRVRWGCVLRRERGCRWNVWWLNFGSWDWKFRFHFQKFPCAWSTKTTCLQSSERQASSSDCWQDAESLAHKTVSNKRDLCSWKHSYQNVTNTCSSPTISFGN